MNPHSTEQSEPEAPVRSAENRLREPLSLILLLLVCLSWVTVRKPDGDHDIWARMAVGKLIIESGEVTRSDPFSYTPKKPEWIDHEWGAGVIFYGVASVGGQKGLLILKALLLFGTLVFIYLRCRRPTGRPPSLMFHLFLVLALHLGFLASVRAQAFTFFFFSAWLYLLERARDGDWRFVWTIPVSGLFWANLHGGFLAGVGLIVLFAAAEFIRRGAATRFGLLAAASGLASLVNPYGLAYWSYLFEATTMDRSSIFEWGPPDLFAPRLIFLGFKVLLVLTVLAILSKALRKDLPDLASLVTLVVTAMLGLRVTRHMTFFVIASAPFAWSWLSWCWDRFVRSSSVARRLPERLAAVAGATYYGLSRGVLLLLTVLILSTAPMRIMLAGGFPVRAVDFITQNQLRGNLLVPFNYGAYAIWRLYPNCRVAFDGRYETVYEDSMYATVSGFFSGAPGSSEFLDGFPHDIILSPRRDQMERKMAERSDWVVAYEDKAYRVYVRAAQQRDWPPLAPPSRADPFSTAGKPRYVP